MFSSTKKSGYVNGIKFEIKDASTIRIWKPSEIALKIVVI